LTRKFRIPIRPFEISHNSAYDIMRREERMVKNGLLSNSSFDMTFIFTHY